MLLGPAPHLLESRRVVQMRQELAGLLFLFLLQSEVADWGPVGIDHSMLVEVVILIGEGSFEVESVG